MTDSYDAFVDKFKPKLTTDDCYTPPLVYEAVADYVAERYGLDKENFVRPFWPGGDYIAFEYKPESVVVDNPPFSLSAKIYRHYIGRGIRFFLFAPSLTLFNSGLEQVCHIGVGASITYENGAVVRTSFATNLEPGVIARSCPELYGVIEEANTKQQKKNKAGQLPAYTYPDNVLTASMLSKYSLRGVAYQVFANEAAHIRQLDDQKGAGKTVFGSGFLVSERAAAERKAAERKAAELRPTKQWRLSGREMAIIKKLSMEARP